MFDIKRAKIYSALKWEKFFVFRYAKNLKKFFFFLFFFVLLIFLYGFISFEKSFLKENNRFFLGLSLIFLVFSLFFQLSESFFNQKLKNPFFFKKEKRGLKEINVDTENLADFLSFETAKAIVKSLKRGRFSEVSSSHLFFFILKDNPNLRFIFERALLDFEEIKRVIISEIKNLELFKKSSFPKFSSTFEETINEAFKIAGQKNHFRVEIGDLLSALARVDPIFKKILINYNLKSEDIDNLVLWLERIEEKIEKRKRFWEYENLAKKETLAKNWSSGYTITLDKYSFDLTELIKKENVEFIGHNEEIKILERSLISGEKNSVLLIGEPGSGRKSLVYHFIERSVLGKSLPQLNYKRVVELNMPSLLAQIESGEEVEFVLDKIFQEVVFAGNIILVINEIHNYLGQEPHPGIVDISGIITPYLRFPQFQLIGITTYEGLHRYIEKNPSVLSLFNKVEVSGISKEETLILLEYFTFGLERKYKIFVSYPALRQIISLTDRYFPSDPFPEKAIKILDAAVVYLISLKKEKVVLPNHIAKVITEKTEIPVGELAGKEKEALLNLEKLIHKRIVNQEEAVKEISTALRRARSGITIRKGPMGCFLFLGPTGVGKTETAKALAENYFGSENKMIRLDMSEFQDIKDISRLIGSEKEIGLLTSAVRETPFSLILLDEIEKSHPNILNLFLQVLDEGYLTDGFGRKVNFKNTIIIATSNAGYEIILNALKEKNSWSTVKSKILDFVFQNRIFRPEFINRFDAVVVFGSLSKENLLSISEMMLSGIKNNLKEKGIEFVVTEALKERIVELGYNPVFGAREMRRVVQDKIENVLAEALLLNQIERGQTITIDPKEFKLTIISRS